MAQVRDGISKKAFESKDATFPGAIPLAHLEINFQPFFPNQIEGPTQFRHSPFARAIKMSREQQNMTIMCLEVVGMVIFTVS